MMFRKLRRNVHYADTSAMRQVFLMMDGTSTRDGTLLACSENDPFVIYDSRAMPSPAG